MHWQRSGLCKKRSGGGGPTAALRSPLSRRKPGRPSRFAPYLRGLAFEALEERALLSVGQDIVNELTPYQAALTNAIDTAASLPLVGNDFKGLQQLNTILQDSLTSVESKTQNLSSGHLQLAIPLPSISPPPLKFDLGLDAFLKVTTAGGVAAAINPTLNVGIDYDAQSGSVTLDAADTNLDIGFSLTLPNFQATMSLNGFALHACRRRGNTLRRPHGFRLRHQRQHYTQLLRRCAHRLGPDAELRRSGIERAAEPGLQNRLCFGLGLRHAGPVEDAADCAEEFLARRQQLHARLPGRYRQDRAKGDQAARALHRRLRYARADPDARSTAARPSGICFSKGLRSARISRTALI